MPCPRQMNAPGAISSPGISETAGMRGGTRERGLRPPTSEPIPGGAGGTYSETDDPVLAWLDRHLPHLFPLDPSEE